MTTPVILKKDNKVIQSFNTIQELANHIGWNYALVYYYATNKKRTKDGFTFVIDKKMLAEKYKKDAKSLIKSLFYWKQSNNYDTALQHAERYLIGANSVLDNAAENKQSIPKMLPIRPDMPFFKHINLQLKIDEYNEKLIAVKNHIKSIGIISMTTAKQTVRTFCYNIDKILPEHLKDCITVGEGGIFFDTKKVHEINRGALPQSEIVSLLCLEELCLKLTESCGVEH